MRSINKKAREMVELEPNRLIMAEKAEELINQLIGHAVDNLRGERNSNNSNSTNNNNNRQTTSITNEIRRLFLNTNSAQVNVNSSSTDGSTNGNNPINTSYASQIEGTSQIFEIFSHRKTIQRSKEGKIEVKGESDQMKLLKISQKKNVFCEMSFFCLHQGWTMCHVVQSVNNYTPMDASYLHIVTAMV